MIGCITLFIVVCSVWAGILFVISGQIGSDEIVLAFIFAIATFLMVAAIRQLIWRWKNGVDLMAVLESDPEVVKSHMLFIMQHPHHEGISGALREFNDIFRNYPQWNLQDWKVFRAWYKALIDRALKNPEIYNLRMKDGSEYSKENDPRYDPAARNWQQYARRSH